MTVTDTYQSYVGRTMAVRDVVRLEPLEGLAALLDTTTEELAPGGELPPLANWLYFREWVRQSELGPDGHPKRGSFLPPVALPRRMKAGGRFTFHEPLRVGDEVERRSTIVSVAPKHGASGELVFVTVRHDVDGPRGRALTEEHDIVYREAGAPIAAEAPPEREPEFPDAAAQLRVCPDPVALFRYSALTANGHRIHYDRRYAMEEEGYPGLVVHGPLQATLLVRLARTIAPGEPRAFSFQARRPLFDTLPFWCVARNGDGAIELSTHDVHGRVCMTARYETA